MEEGDKLKKRDIASVLVMAQLLVGFKPVASLESEPPRELPPSITEAKARAIAEANRRLRIHRALLFEVKRQKDSTNLGNFLNLLKVELTKERPDRRFPKALLTRLVRFNDEQCLRFLVTTAEDNELPEPSRRWAVYSLAALRTNWAEETLNVWRNTETADLFHRQPTAPNRDQLLREFQEKVRNPQPHSYDLSQVQDERMRELLRAESKKPPSFYREIQQLAELEVREAKPLVLELLDSSQDYYTRQAALEYLGNLFWDDSFDIFVKFLEDEYIGVRSEAIKCLGKIGSDKAIRVLSERAKQAGLTSNEQLAIVRALVGSDKAEATDALIECDIRLAEADGSGSARIALIEALGKRDNDKAIDHLISVANSDWRGRAVAFWALAGIENEKVTRFLHSQRENEDVRIKAVSAASAASHGDKDAIEELISAWKSDPYPRAGSNIYQWLPSHDRKQLLKLMCRMKGTAIPFVIDTLNDQRMGGTWPDEFRRECQDILNARAEEISRELADYIKALSEDKWFTPSWAMAVEAYCLVEEPTEEMLPALRNAYARFEEQSLETINRYGRLRKMLALKLEAVDGKRYPYTYFEAPGRQ